jgi:hypothetical protein
MVTRTRFLVLVLVATLGSTGIAVASTVEQQAVQQPAQVERVHRFYRTGPSAEYHGDAGGIGQVRPLRFETTGGAPRVAVAEASFGYRTRGAGPFVVTLRIGEVDGPQVTVRPEELELAPAPDGAATTVRFLAPELAAGATYEAHLGVNSVFARRNTIHTRGVVLTIELS